MLGKLLRNLKNNVSLVICQGFKPVGLHLDPTRFDILQFKKAVEAALIGADEQVVKIFGSRCVHLSEKGFPL